MSFEDWQPRNRQTFGNDREQLGVGDGIGQASRMEREVLLGHDIRQGKPKSSFPYRTRFVSGDGKEAFDISDEQYSMHLLLIGGIGCGKTNTFHQIVSSIKNYLSSNDVMIIFDSKGDFYGNFYSPWDSLVGNSRMYRQQSSIWNIYAEVMEQMPPLSGRLAYDPAWALNAKEIMKSLYKSRRSSQQPFFADAAADMIAKKIDLDIRRACANGNFAGLHTYCLREFFQKATLKSYDKEFLAVYPNVKQYYGEGNTPQSLAVFAYINSLVEDCFVGVFGDKPRPGQKEFAMRELVRKKDARALFVEYDLSSGEVLGPLYQMLYDQALKEALGRQEGEPGNVYLICDEFKLLGTLEHMDDGLNFGRSLGVKICAGLQSINQVYDLYGEEKGKAILSGFSNVFCFRTGDAETRKFISEHFGNNYSDISLRNTSGDLVHMQREGNVIEQWDVLGLKRGQAVVGLWHPEPKAPFLFQFEEFQGGR